MLTEESQFLQAFEKKDQQGSSMMKTRLDNSKAAGEVESLMKSTLTLMIDQRRRHQ
jgi:hypothetical protein